MLLSRAANEPQKPLLLIGKSSGNCAPQHHHGVGITAVVWFEKGLSIEFESTEVAT